MHRQRPTTPNPERGAVLLIAAVASMVLVAFLFGLLQIFYLSTAVSQAQSATRPDDSTSYNGVPAYLVARLDENIKDYHLQFDLLMTMLRDGLATEKVGTAARDIVRFLSFRLDFNEFHANKNKHLPQFPGV